MAGEGGNQDWWGLLYLFLAGVVSIVVDVVRRLSMRLETLLSGEDDDRASHHHHRCTDDDCEDYPHRRWDDPPYKENTDDKEDGA